MDIGGILLKLNKCIFLILIILISLLSISAVTASDDNIMNGLNDLHSEDLQSVDSNTNDVSISKENPGQNSFLSDEESTFNSFDEGVSDFSSCEDVDNLNSCEEGVSDFSSCEDVDNLNSCEEGVSDFSSSAYDENSPEDLNLDKNDDISPSVSKNALLSCADSKSSNILSKSNEATVTVTPSAQSYKYGSDVRLTIGLTGMDGIALDGLVVITLDNKQYLANVTGGSANLIVSGLENNTYSVFAEFLGNDLYESSTNSDATFVVNKSKVVTADVSVMDIVYGETATVTIANLSDVDGKTLSVFGGYQLVGPKNPYGSFFVRKGKGSFSVEGLPAGNYSAYVVFGNNVGESHEFKNYIVNFTVKKADPILSADTKDIVFGENGTVNISVLGVKTEKLNETLLITLNSEEYGSIDSVNGMANLVLPDLTVGNYTVGISFRGINSTNYNSAGYACSFNVEKARPDLTVIGSEVEWGKDSIVNVKAEHNGNPVAGNVIVQVDLGERSLYQLISLDENGEGQASFALKEGVNPDTFDLIATFIGDDKYESIENNQAKIIITDSRDLNMELSADEVTYGEDSLIRVSAKDGRGVAIEIAKVNLTINGQREEYELDENGTVNIGKLGVGSIPVTISFDDGFHRNAQKEITVTVIPSSNAELDLSYGEGMLNIEAKDGNNPLNGSAIVIIDGKEGHSVTGDEGIPVSPGEEGEGIPVSPGEGDEGIPVSPGEGDEGIPVSIGEDGKAELPITGLSPGNHTITVIFTNDNYQAVRESISLTVPKYDNATIKIITESIKEGEVAKINITVKEGENSLDGMAILSLDDMDYYINVIGGKGSVNIKNLLANEYTVSAKFLSDDKYEEANDETRLVVMPEPIMEQTGTVISIIAANVSYGDKAVINFTLKDTLGKPLSGVLNVTVGGQVKKVTVDNGVGSLTLTGLNADTYPIVANYGGEEAYSSSVGTAYFNVAKKATKIIFKDMNTMAIDYYNDGRVGQYFTWKLVDSDGNPMANVPMQIGFNGVVYDKRNGIVTDKNGVAKLQINLMRVDLYTFAICFLGDENHNASFVVAKITVKAQTPSLTVPNKSYKAKAKTKTLTATFKSNKGTLIPNKKVTFTVNGKSYSAKTNSKGVASVKVSLNKKGTYKVTAKYAGDNTYSSITKTASLKLT